MMAERKDRKKWSQDPRNTFWSKGEQRKWGVRELRTWLANVNKSILCVHLLCKSYYQGCSTFHGLCAEVKVEIRCSRPYSIICTLSLTVKSFMSNPSILGPFNWYSCFWSGVFPGNDVGRRGLSNLETKCFGTKHYSSLTPYTTAKWDTYKKAQKNE